MMQILTVEEQRTQFARRAMTAIGLEAHLRLLMREILDGDMTNVQQFQQDLHYASPELRERLAKALDTKQLAPWAQPG